MKRVVNRLRVSGILSFFALAVGIAQPMTAQSQALKLANKPLADSTTTEVLPNLMFILDSSGSMAWNYSPDWVDDSICKNTNGSYNLDCENSPLFQSPDINGVYYNPDIYYRPPVAYDGTPYPDQTTWTNVKNNAFSSSSGTTNLVSGYVDVEWCTDTSYSNCLRNDNYVLPGTVNGKSYTVQHLTVATGTKGLASSTSSTTTREVGPHYYRVTPGEYCTTSKLTDCQRTQDSTHTYAARIRWCKDDANAKAAVPAAGACQGLRTSGFTSIRFPTKYDGSAQPAVNPVPAKATFVFAEASRNSSCSSSRTAGIASITVNGQNILPNPTSNVSTATALANAIRAQTAKNGYTFSGSGSTVIITAPVSAGDTTLTITTARTATSSSQCTFTPTSAQLGGYVPGTPAIPVSAGAFARTDIVASRTSYPKAAGRTDCKGATCTYTEEMTNFANWWTYYQTRMQTMKTAASLAFKSIDSRYRVGFIDIYGTNYLPITKFVAGAGGAKDVWYTKLFSMTPNGGTPLRSALARVGQLYAGQKPVGSADPMQYSCQQNFALLTTDGYWNGDAPDKNRYGTITKTYINDLNGNPIGDRDGGSTPRPLYEGPTASEDSLADVAKYYYDTDLRTSALSNCKGSEGVDVCENNVFVSGTDNNQKQHMTTFTLGLGVDGTLLYQNDYKTAGSGDFYDISHGSGATPNWPVPKADTETAVDDLWHAAVNGQGTYFSAKDPSQLTSGLNAALSAIGSKVGAGSAAATSSLNPVAGDNYAYVASYTTVKWQGNLEERSIDLTTGDVSLTPQWCVEDTVAASCPDGSITSSSDGSTVNYYCSIPSLTAASCEGNGGTLGTDGTTCNIPVSTACTGTMRSLVGASDDQRTIKMVKGSALVDFKYDNLSDTQKALFSGTVLSGLSQWSDLNTDQQTAAAGENLINYLRGQKGYEDRTSNTVDRRLYRYREATLGDITESQPQFVGKPVFKYTDPGYGDYISDMASRAKTVFVGANDGMLHAFNAETGKERWAFVPTAVLPNLWRLADRNYSSNHVNYVNGRPVVGDVYDATQQKWRTILVAGLNGGGRAYYALDVTDTTNPTFLWEIDSTTEPNLGYSYGYPVITKDTNGKWVVLLTSGYNNINPGDGGGYLFIRDALSGDSIATIATGAGDKDTPSGLARISNYGDDPMHNNTSVATYGGDLLGNLWRFDISKKTVMKLAALVDSSGDPQPITTAPELGLAYGKRIVYVGTGKYLEEADLQTTQKQSLYAIKDSNVSSTLTNLRSVLTEQTITQNGATRTSSNNPVDMQNGSGWYIDWPDTGERENVDPILDSGLLIAPTTVPSSTVCAPGGYGWLNYFNYLTGANDKGIVSQKYNAPIVGINVYYTPDGKRHVGAVTSDEPTPKQPGEDLPNSTGQFNFQGKRVIWRELIP